MRLRLKPDKDGWFFFLNDEQLGALPHPSKSFYVWTAYDSAWDRITEWVLRCG